MNTATSDTCMNTTSDLSWRANINSDSTSNHEHNRGSNNNNNNSNWVRNYSKTPLTDAQQQLLSHGPNFVIVPRDLPTLEYIVATEKVCNQLTQGKVEELRGEVKSLLTKDHKAKPNIPKDDHQVLREIKRDKHQEGSHS